MRCCNEASLHDSSMFLTLTWAVDPFELDHRPYQLFMKRLRKSREPDRIGYFMCGEYGERFSRPHYHALIFGADFPDRRVLKGPPMPLWRSAELERLWPHGHASFGAVTMESAQYVAGYVVSRKTGQEAEDHYWKLNEATGELSQVTPEYGRMSLNPAVGRVFFEKFHHDVTVRDGSVINGSVMKPPRYYDRQLRGFASVDRKKGTASVRRGIDRRLYDEHQAKRLEVAEAMLEDSTPERLAVMETVVKSRAALKRRLLEF